MPTTKVRTTVALPGDLLEAVDAAVREGGATSRNEFLAMAARDRLRALRREAIDEAFAAMAKDPVYRQEALEIAEEFGPADWEAFRIAESDS